MTPSAADSSVSRGLPRRPLRFVVFVRVCVAIATSAWWLTALLLVRLVDASQRMSVNDTLQAMSLDSM